MEQRINEPQTGVILAILVIAVILVGGVVGYLFLISNPQAIFMSKIDMVSKAITVPIVKDSKTLAQFNGATTNKFNIKLDYKNDANQPFLQNDVSVDYTIDANVNSTNQYNKYFIQDNIEKSKKIAIHDSEEETLLEVPGINEYVRLQEALSTMIDIKKENSVAPEDVAIMFDRTTAQFKKQFKENDFYKVVEKEMFEGKEINVNKYGLLINGERLAEILKGTCQNLKTDKKFLTTYISAFSTEEKKLTSEDVVKVLDQRIAEIDALAIDPNIKIEIVINAKGLFNDTLTGVDIFIQEQDTVLLNIECKIENGQANIEFKAQSKDLLFITIVEKDGAYEAEIMANKNDKSDKYAKLVFDIRDFGFNIQYNIVFPGMKISGDSTFDWFVDGNVLTSELKLNMSGNVNNISIGKLSILLDTKTKAEKTKYDLEVKEVIDQKDLTQEHIMKLIDVLPFINEVQAIVRPMAGNEIPTESL